MNPAHPVSGEMLQRVRQQLILAQVRIMELEDTRDETGARLGENERLLQAAVTLADQKMDEAAHADKVRADLQARFIQLQQIQQEAQAALGAAQVRLAEAERALAAGKQGAADLAAQLRQVRETESKLTTQLHEITATSAARQQRIGQLDAEIRAMKSSRCWRWTAWLRSLERTFRGPRS